MVPPSRAPARNSAGLRVIVGTCVVFWQGEAPLLSGISAPSLGVRQGRDGHIVSQNDKTLCRKMVKELRVLVVEGPGFWAIVGAGRMGAPNAHTQSSLTRSGTFRACRKSERHVGDVPHRALGRAATAWRMSCWFVGATNPSGGVTICGTFWRNGSRCCRYVTVRRRVRVETLHGRFRE